MIKHFDLEESDLIEFAAKTYSRGVIPLEPAAGYPQLFYYLAGIFLSPYTFFKGINFQVITITLRSFNVLISILSALTIYFFVLRFFKSTSAAILSSLIFATSPFTLGFSVNSRPHTLSTLFFMLTFYYCFLAVEKYKPHYIRLSVLFSAFSTATNFFGIFSIPAISLAYLHYLSRSRTADLAMYLKSRKLLIYLISCFYAILAIFIPLTAIFVFLKLPRLFHMLGVDNLKQFLNYRNFKIICLVSTLLILVSTCLMVANYLSGKIYNNAQGYKKYRWAFLFSAISLNTFFVLSNTVLFFLVLNPAYLFFPAQNIKSNLLQASVTTMGSGLNGHHRAIFDLSGFFIWSKMLFDNHLLNKWFALLFLLYLIYEILRLIKNRFTFTYFDMQKCLLWSSCLFLFLTLAVCASHRPHHYLPPINIVIGIFLSFGTVEIIKLAKKRVLKYILTFIFAFIFFSGLNMRRGPLERLIYLKNFKMSDTGLVIGQWLEQNYKDETMIWKDVKDFYIPPKFKNVFFMSSFETIAEKIPEINTLGPKILIITSKFDPELTNVKLINAAIKNGDLDGYHEAGVFRYQGPLALQSNSGFYKEIHIYAQKEAK